MCINWEAVGAMGQWVGAIGTIWAVRIAVNADKTSFRIKKSEIAPLFENSPGMSLPRLKFLVINNRNYPVNIIEAGFITSKGEKVKYNNYFSSQLPKSDKMQKFIIELGALIKYLKDMEYTGNVAIQFYIKDESDRMHKCSFALNVQQKKQIQRWQSWILRFLTLNM